MGVCGIGYKHVLLKNFTEKYSRIIKLLKYCTFRRKHVLDYKLGTKKVTSEPLLKGEKIFWSLINIFSI